MNIESLSQRYECLAKKLDPHHKLIYLCDVCSWAVLFGLAAWGVGGFRLKWVILGKILLSQPSVLLYYYRPSELSVDTGKIRTLQYTKVSYHSQFSPGMRRYITVTLTVFAAFWAIVSIVAFVADIS